MHTRAILPNTIHNKTSQYKQSSLVRDGSICDKMLLPETLYIYIRYTL